MLNGNNGEQTEMTNSGKAVDVKVEGKCQLPLLALHLRYYTLFFL